MYWPLFVFEENGSLAAWIEEVSREMGRGLGGLLLAAPTRAPYFRFVPTGGSAADPRARLEARRLSPSSHVPSSPSIRASEHEIKKK